MGDAGDARVAAVLERYRRALAEIERLSRADDHGSGERTARLSALGAWEVVAADARRELDALTSNDCAEGRGA